MQGAEKLIIRHTEKAKDSVSLKTIEEKDRQFLIEKIIHWTEFNNPYNISNEKKPEIIDMVEKNYRISRRVYQSLFVDIADSFIEYIHSLDVNETQQLDDDLKVNGWGTKSLLEIENAYELLNIFQMFYYFNGRLSLTNGLLIVPDGEVSEVTEKINLKLLYEMLKDTQSYGLTSIQFLWAISFFIFSIPKYALTELYKNLLYETLSGVGDLKFEEISDLVGEISFQIKNSTLLNIKRKKNKTRDKKRTRKFWKRTRRGPTQRPWT